MSEEWRPVVGYEGLYEVSNTGQVRSLDMYVKCRYGNYRLHKGKVLSPVKDKKGYLKVVLCCNGKCKTIKVHRLIAQAFLLNPDNLPQVNHKDEDKTNNCVENLEWCTAKYNNNYGTRKDKVRETAIKNGYCTGLSKEEYIKEYREKNREKIREYRKEYAQKYYQKNKDKARSYYQENRERIREQQKEYKRKKKEEIQNNVH